MNWTLRDGYDCLSRIVNGCVVFSRVGGCSIKLTIDLPYRVSRDCQRRITETMIRAALAEIEADAPTPYTFTRSDTGQPHAEARPDDTALMTPTVL